MVESNANGPSATWQAWARGEGGLREWVAAAGSALPPAGETGIKIIYRWYNSSADIAVCSSCSYPPLFAVLISLFRVFPPVLRGVI